MQFKGPILFLAAFIVTSPLMAEDLPTVVNSRAVANPITNALTTDALPDEPLPLNHWSKDSHGWTGGWLTGPTIDSTPLKSVPVFNVPGFKSNTESVPLETTKMAELAQKSFVNHALNEDNIHAGEVILQSVFNYQLHLETDLGPTFMEIFRQPRTLMEVKSIFAYLLQSTFLKTRAAWNSHMLIETIDYDLYYLEGLRWDSEHGIRTNRLKAKNQNEHGDFIFGELMGVIVRYNKITKEMVFLTSPQVFSQGYEGIGQAHYKLKNFGSKGKFLMITQPKSYGVSYVELVNLNDPKLRYKFRSELKHMPTHQYYYRLLDGDATQELGHTTFWQTRVTAEDELMALIEKNLPSALVAKCEWALVGSLQKILKGFRN